MKRNSRMGRGSMTIAAIALFLLFGQPRATTYYVSAVNGDDSRSTAQAHSINTPWKSIQKAAELMTAGDICILRQGAYRETVRPANSGTTQSPILFVAYSNEHVVISGADELTGWRQASGRWETTLKKKPWEVFADSLLMLWARHPNMPFFPGRGFEFFNPNCIHTPLPSIARFDSVFMWECTNYPGWQGMWVWRKTPVTSAAEIQTEVARGVYAARVIVMGAPELLDAPGEWFFSDTILRFIPPPGVSPLTSRIEAQVRDVGIDLRNRSNVVFRGIGLFACRANLDSATFCTIDSCHAQYVSSFASLGNGGWTRGDTALSVGGILGLGISLGGTNNTLKNSIVEYGWGDGVTLGGKSNIVDNCVIHDLDWSGTDCAPLSAGGDGHTIRHCTIYNAGRTVLLHRGLHNGKILYNNLYNCGYLTGDMGITYSWRSNDANTEIAYNWVHNNLAGEPNMGIYLDNGLSGILVHHNVIWGCQFGIWVNRPNNGHRIYNNTVTNTEDLCHYDWDDGGGVYGGLPNVDPDTQNNFRAMLTQNWNPRPYSPWLVNQLANDFRLKAGAPAIDQGTIMPSITDGYLGTAPDRGAYEFNGARWTAGADSSLFPLTKKVYGKRTPRRINAWDADDYSQMIGPRWTYLGGMTTMCWVRYDSVDFGQGGYNKFFASILTDDIFGGGPLELRLDSLPQRPSSTISLGPSTTFSEQSASMDSTVKGMHTIYLLGQIMASKFGGKAGVSIGYLGFSGPAVPVHPGKNASFSRSREDVVIYSINGALVARSRAGAFPQSMHLSTGIFIMRPLQGRGSCSRLIVGMRNVNRPNLPINRGGNL